MFKFKTKPFPHQKECFEKFKDSDILAELADMGTGKSKVCIDICAYRFLKGLHDRVLVISTPEVHPQWVDEQFPEHCSVPWQGLSYIRKKSNKLIRQMDSYLMFETKNKEKLSVLTINFESFVRPIGPETAERFFKTSDKPPVIIIDEASRIKNPDAKTTIAIKHLVSSYPDSFRIILTGTPAAKSPVDMWSIYDFLKPRYMGCSYTAFQAEHSVRIKRKFKVKDKLVTKETTLDSGTYEKIHKSIAQIKRITGGHLPPEEVTKIRRRFGLTEEDFWYVAGSSKMERFKNLDAVQEKIAPDTFSITKEEALELPPKVYERITFPLNKEQKRLIKELQNYSATMYEDNVLTIEMKALLGTRVLQICGGFFSHNTEIEGEFKSVPISGVNKKLNYIKGDIPEIGNGQFITWAVFVPELEMLYEELKTTCDVGLLMGGMTEADRHRVVQDYKKGKFQGLVSNPSVGGYGLNLQMSSVQYWYSRNFRTETRLQAEDRSHRIGILKSPTYKDLLYDVVFEHKLLNTIKEEQSINDFFMNGSSSEIFKLL